MSTKDTIAKLRNQRASVSMQLSSIGRGIDLLREGSKTADGKKMTEAHARAAFIFVCDALGLDASETGEKFIEFACGIDHKTPPQQVRTISPSEVTHD